MFDRLIAFLKELPDNSGGDASDDPRVAATALLFHVMDADGVRQDVERERIKALVAQAYGIGGEELKALLSSGERADNEAIDFYAFTTVLKRHLDEAGRADFIRLMWEVVYADGEVHELEDNTLWRVAELLDVDRQGRIAARRQVQGRIGAKASD